MVDDEPTAGARLERDEHGRPVAGSDDPLTDELLWAAIDAGRR